jgi:hypothetical protein
LVDWWAGKRTDCVVRRLGCRTLLTTENTEDTEEISFRVFRVFRG